ncbi:MAG: hypothetical protein H6722_08860 [Sandaracinus sp.]|nr:hypothetical protein [Sandaracinus sp.]
MNVLEGESARLALRMRSGDRIPEAWLTLAASRRVAGMAVQGAASLSDVVLVDAAGGRRTIPFAEALSITATIHDRDATVHVTLVADGLTRGGRIAEATVVSGAFSAWLFDESAASLGSRHVHEDDEEDDDEAVGGWAAAAAASASAKKREVVEDAELTWAQVAAVSESARAAPPRPTKLRSRPRVEPTVLLPKVESIPTRRDRAVEPEYLDEPMPERGDHVSHKQFGLCKVERIDDDGGLRVKLPGGQRKQIKLDPFTVQGPRTDGAGRRVFDLVPRRK